MISRRDAARALEVPLDASPQVVLRAFRRRAAVEHPDRGGDPASFVRLVAAREKLLDIPRGRPAAPPPRDVPRRAHLLARLLDLLLRGMIAWEHRHRFGARGRDRVS